MRVCPYFFSLKGVVRKNIRFFDMFSGIGGFREGLNRAGGFSCVGHCEIDKYADRSYRAIFNTEGEWFCNDAKKIRPEELPEFDLLCGGFPCQAFSVAGKRQGFEDARGTLFFEIARLVKARRPPYLLLENVPGLLSHNKGATFNTILYTLYEKDALVATLTTDEDGKAEIGELPLGSYYLKETTAGDHFVLNPEQKEFTLSAEDDTVSVVYEGVTYKNERQKIQISVEKKNSVTKEALEGVVFGLYAGEDIKNTQGKVVVEKDTLLETKATDQEGRLTFESDLWHGHYYVKEDQHLPGYLPNDEIWEIDATYEDQNLPAILLEKEVENQPTESYFTKTDIVTGEPVEGAKLQILDEEGTVVREWITTKEEHLEYALPAGNYILHEELPPLEDGYVSAEDVSFEVKEDGTITKVEMKDDFSKVDISKTDITGDTELVGVKLQVLNSKEEVLDEWISDGTEHPIEYLPVGEELTLRETQTISGYTLAEDVKFTLEDTGEVQKVSMKNEFVYGKIFLRKTDLQSGDALAGAEFEIRNKTTNEVAGVLKTDQNGQAESEELLIGSYNEKGIKELFQYEVVETKAPEGYQLDSRPHPVTFDLEGEKDGEILVELDVTNQRIPTDAPKTGDDTVSPMLLLGICAVCTGILIGCFVYRKKKQETDEKEEN